MSVVILVGLEGSARTLSQTLARLLDLEAQAVATAEEALRRPPEGPILTRMRLPRLNGASLLRRASLATPGRRGLLLTARPIAGPPSLALDPALHHVVAPHQVGPLFDGLLWASGVEVPVRHRTLVAAWRQGPERLALEVQDNLQAPDEELSLGLELVAHTSPPGAALATLGQWLSAPQLSPTVAEQILSLLPRFYGAGLDLIAAIARRPELPPGLRARAIQELGRRYPLAATQVVLHALLDDPSPWCRSEAAHALVDGARAAAAHRDTVRLVGGLAHDVLVQLAREVRVDPEARGRAVAFLAKEAPTAQVLPILSGLAASPPPELAALASRWLVRADGLEAEAQRQVLEDEGRPLAERRLALEHIALELPEEQSAPLLERAESSATPEIRDRALQLHFAAAEGGIEDSLARAIHGGLRAQRAALLGALEQGRGSPVGLLAIARSGFEEELVVAALRVLGARYDVTQVGAGLRAALADVRPAVRRAAHLALVQQGERGWPLLMEVAQDPALAASVRSAAIGELAEAAEPERVRAAARRMANDPDPILATSSVRAVVLSGATALPELARRLAERPRIEHYQGWIEGALALGTYGYGALAMLLADPSAPLAVRGEVLRRVLAEFDALDAQPLFDASPDEVRALAQGPAVTPSPEVGGQEPATQPAFPAAAPEPDQPRRRRRTKSTVSSPPAAAPAPAPPPLEEDDHPEDRAPTKPVPPAKDAAPPPPIPAAASPIPRASSSRPRAAATETGTQDGLPPIPRDRAEQVLEECVRQGTAGLRGLKLLALSPRVPDPVRAAAVRHLASDFDEAQRGDVLTRCLRGPPLVQATALGCLMVQKEPPRAALEVLALDPAAELSTRLRTLRFLASRFGRQEVAPMLLRVLECGHAELERAALESLFTSIRFTPELAVEEALVNLLREHESLQVKTWAAQALGTFGGTSALPHLDHFTGLFGEIEVKAVAKRAHQRIVARLRG